MLAAVLRRSQRKRAAGLHWKSLSVLEKATQQDGSFLLSSIRGLQRYTARSERGCNFGAAPQGRGWPPSACAVASRDPPTAPLGGSAPLRGELAGKPGRAHAQGSAEHELAASIVALHP